MLEQLERLGFKESPVPSYEKCDARYFKTVYRDKENEDSDSLLLEVKFWRFSKYSNPQNIVEDCWSCTGYLDISCKNFTVDYSIETPLEDVIDWFKWAFVRLGGVI